METGEKRRRGRKLRVEWATEDDAASLRARYRVERRADVRPRLQGLWLVRTGRTTREVAEVVGVEERTVQRWLAWYRAGGLAEVAGRHAHGGGAAPFLTAEQQADLAGEVETGRLIERLQPSVLLLASPNNPTGTALPPSQLRAVLDVAPAWWSSTRPTPSSAGPACPARCSCWPSYPQLVVTRTMSKAFALAGGRLGYLAASAEVVDALRIVRLPYHLSAVSQATALAALAHSSELQAALDTLRAERDATVRLAARAGAARAGIARPTSCCSAPSPTGTRCGRAWSNAVCWSARPARTAGCGSRSAPPRR